MAELIHTCYRVLDPDASVAFYEKLGFEVLRRMPIGEDATNVFMGLPGDGPRRPSSAPMRCAAHTTPRTA